MFLKVARFIDLLLVALTLGLTFCHALEIFGKMQLSSAEWLAVQQHLYNAFGPVGGMIELLSVVMTWTVFAMVLRRRPAKTLTLIASLCVTAALIVWFATVRPMNTVFNGWTAATMPVDWRTYRNQWETGHAVSAALFAVAFCGLVAALLAEIPEAGAVAPRP
jgi:hypothetical protein